jgi:hypothetical protein
VALADEQTDLDEGDNHHRSRPEKVKPERNRKILALTHPVSESLTGRREEDKEREGQNDEAAHDLS